MCLCIWKTLLRECFFLDLVLLYFVIMLIAYLRNKPLLIDELINFATQYGLVQKQLLNEFEIPYALVDYNAKFLWVNEQFTEVTGKDKKYHKSVMTVFPDADQGAAAAERAGGVDQSDIQ